MAIRFGLWLIKHWEADLAVAGKTSAAAVAAAAAAAFAAARHRRHCWDGAMIHTSVFLSPLLLTPRSDLPRREGGTN